MRPILVAVLWAVLTGVSLANDGWAVTTGDGYQFGKSNKYIQMVSEDLRIILDERGAKVDVRYVFKNHGPATRVAFGFPESRGNIEEPAMERFRTWVDGRRVPARRKSLSSNRDLREYEAAWIKEVSFRKGGSRRVRVTYEIGFSGNSSGDIGFYYSLGTAQSWKMPVRDFKVTVDWTRFTNTSKPVFTLPGAMWAWKPAGWRKREAVLRNFVPRDLLSLDLRTGFWNFRRNGSQLPLRRMGSEWVIQRNQSFYLPAEELDMFFKGVHIEGKWIVFSNGKRKRLLSGTSWRRVHRYADLTTCVSLRDVVRAVGGRMVYIRGEERVDLTIPKAFVADKQPY